MEALSRQLRILHLISSERWTGAAEPVTSLAGQQAAMGHEVWVGCIPGRSFHENVVQRGLRIVEGLHLNRRLHPLHLLSDMGLVRRFVHEQQIDIVHCHLEHDHWLAGLALRGMRRKNGGPRLIRTIHGTIQPHNNVAHRWLYLRETDRLVCTSGFAARQFEQVLNLPSGTIPHVSGAVDVDRFRPGLDPRVIRAQLGIPENAPTVGIVARMRAGRGIRWLMQAMPEVLARVPDARLFVVGRGELKKWYRAETQRPEYQGRALYAGYRKEDLPLAYAAMDASLFLGMGSEGTCRAILEAMACSRPTIGADVGPVGEIIADGQTGVLVRNRDVSDLAEKLITLLSNREKCLTMGQLARERAEREFGERPRAEAFERIYAEVAHGQERI